MAADKTNMSIVAEAPGYLQVFSDGTVKRFSPPSSPSPAQHLHTTTLFNSTDVIIDASKPISARIFVPSAVATPQLPVLVYFHGGGFCIGSTTWSGLHHFLGGLCVRSRCIVLSVDYRLAPEHRLPVAYEDCYSSVEWLASAGLENADLSRVFLSGESAGGNIAHHVMLRLLRAPVRGVQIQGLLVIHPFFGSEARIEGESKAPGGDEAGAGGVALSDMFWRLSLPEGADRDHPACNMEKAAEQVSSSEWRGFPRTMVFVAGRDMLRERGTAYGDLLRRKGVGEVTVQLAAEEMHAFHVFYPHSEATQLLQAQMADFIHPIPMVS